MSEGPAQPRTECAGEVLNRGVIQSCALFSGSHTFMMTKSKMGVAVNPLWRWAAAWMILGLLVLAESASAATVGQEQNFINAVYLDLLNRPADAPALAQAGALVAGTLTGQQFAQSVLVTAEYRTDLISSYYNSYLGRAVDTPALNAFVSFLSSGGTDQGVQSNILGSPEFFSRSLGTNVGFIGALYADLLNRAPSGPELSGWQNALGSGTTRTQVASSVLGSSEYDTDLVTSYYSLLLRRSPDSPGLNAFVNLLQAGGTNEIVIANIVGSAEFFTLAQVPEPGSWMLMAIGSAFLLAKPRRTK